MRGNMIDMNLICQLNKLHNLISMGNITANPHKTITCPGGLPECLKACCISLMQSCFLRKLQFYY